MSEQIELRPIKVKAIKSGVGYFCQIDVNYYRGPSDGSGLELYYFDGKLPEKTHNSKWVKIPKKPVKIERELSQPDINYRYELIDKSLESKKFPLVFKREEVAEIDPDDKWGDWVWKEEYKQLKSLYELRWDKQPKKMFEIDFEFNIILEVDKIEEYGGFSYPIQRTRWEHEGFVSCTERDVKHDLVDTIIFPDIILPARKSELTSHQAYKIIRKHIQDNIDPKYAHITNDYDFCFTVKKKIPLVEKIAYQKDISRWGAKKPKYVTDYRENREIDVFEMTYSGEGGNYKGYTPIAGFKGKNVKELKENIDEYLSELMKIINEPLCDCPNCKGKGVVLNK